MKKLTAAGVEVTGVIYMQSVGASSEYAQYITPTGRDAASQGATLAGMNATEAGPRKKLEALFACLADAFSDPDCQIGNWVIGNEVDNPVNWNWCGGISEDQYIQQYADVYRMNLKIGNLPLGAHRSVTDEELKELKALIEKGCTEGNAKDA